MSKPGRGVKRAADAVGNRITKIDELLVSADPLSRVHLTQERIELHAEYVRLTNGNHADPSQLERDFVRVVRSYGDRNGITYAAWRQVGVDAKLLERAGIHKAEKKGPPAAIRAERSEAERSAADGPGSEEDNVASPASRGTHNGSGPARPEPVPAPSGEAGEAGGASVAGGTREPGEAGEVRLDELAGLLAAGSSGPAAPSRDRPDQPSLGEHFGTSSGGPGQAVPDRSHPRSSGP